MSKVHFPRSTSNYNSALASDNVTAVIAIPAACGTRTTDRAVIDLSTDPEVVDCQKCRAALPEPTVEERMRTAYAAGDLEEVVRLSRLLG